ncbi:MAG TPA: GntR family transcriptional regulator [Clostridia bacterium]|nr:GntR family transcriptional regulator [Clostridia bacterium]
MLEILAKTRHETTREYVIRVLRYNIENLTLKPGQLVSENELAQSLGVSRTPVREALIELSRTGVVEIYPQKGTFISLIDLSIVEEARFLRCTVEKAIVQLACEMCSEEDLAALEDNLQLQRACVERNDYRRLMSLDNEFHRLMYAACNKEMTYSLIQSVMTHFNRVRLLNLAEMDMQRTVDDHEAILKAVKSRNKDEAVAVVERHLSRVLFDKNYLMQLHPDYFK